MADNSVHDAEERLARRRDTYVDVAHRSNTQPSGTAQDYSPALLRASQGGRRGSTGIRSQVMLAAQRTHGNRAVQRSISPGNDAGATATGEGHPELEELARRRLNGPLGALAAIVGGTVSDAGGLLGTLWDGVSRSAGGGPAAGSGWVGATAQGSANVGGGATYEHNTASTARNAERRAATKGSEVPLDRATLERMEASGMW
jgi:hypothetical protein